MNCETCKTFDLHIQKGLKSGVGSSIIQLLIDSWRAHLDKDHN